MSKEREDFESSVRKEFPNCNLTHWKDGYSDDDIQIRYESWQACATHYQPLLDAKDAEIARLQSRVRRWRMVQEADGSFTCTDLDADENTTLKALLEQAREALRLMNKELLFYAKKAGEDITSASLSVLTPLGHARLKCCETLAAINAATGSTRIEDSVRSIKSCETSLIGGK